MPMTMCRALYLIFILRLKKKKHYYYHPYFTNEETGLRETQG